jgi:hypothetical protein
MAMTAAEALTIDGTQCAGGVVEPTAVAELELAAAATPIKKAHKHRSWLLCRALSFPGNTGQRK